ncbi:MAG: bifunctional DedA family/phosphatase PAP2 family protein [Bacillota bacterium]
MLDRLTNLIAQLGHWGYLIIFLAVTLESAAFLGFVVPGETLVVFGGFLAARRVLKLADLIPLVCIGAILGDSIGYEVGKHLGRAWLLRHGRWVGLHEAHLKKVEGFFERHGGKTVIIGRFSAFLRALTPFVAGTSHMRYFRFLFYNALGGIVWGVIFVLLGYFLGASWKLIEHWVGRASAVLGGTFLLILALVWLGRWLIRNERAVRHQFARLIHRPAVLKFRRRFAPQIAFIKARLTPRGLLGLHLTLGVLVLVAAAGLFVVIARGVMAGDPLTLLDERVALWLYDHATPGLTQVMTAISYLGSLPVIFGLTVLFAADFLWRREGYRLLALLLTVPVGALLNSALTHLFHRDRPPFAVPMPYLSRYGFPSSRATVAVLLYGLVAVFIVRRLRTWRWRVVAVLIASFLILLIGLSLIYLDIQYLSDVLAGYVEGIAWLAICLTSVESLRRARQPAAHSQVR